jgi:glycosyltransferase involved in cell wall biosynthesis
MIKNKTIIVDMSNIKVGGGIQVALSFLNYFNSNFPPNDVFYFILSTPVYKQFSNLYIDRKNIFIIDTNYMTIIPWAKSRIKIRRLIKKIDPDSIFTLFGPSFWGEGNNHTVGFANAWIVSPDTIAYDELPFFYRYKFKFKNFILGKLLYSKRRKYITETNDIRNKFVQLFNADPDQISVVPNSLPFMYSQENFTFEMPLAYELYPKTFKFVTIAENYPHKNIKIIESVGHLLYLSGHRFIFFVTMTESDYEKKSVKFKSVTHNLGRLKVADCPSYYFYADVMFLPTLLECFSVSYLEAMYCGTVIATSNLSFSREVCGDAAIFFDAKSPTDIYEKLSRLINNPNVMRELSSKSKKQLDMHINNKQRSEIYLNKITK